MSLLFMDGFDHYVTADVGKKWNNNTGLGFYAINASAGRRGGGCLRWSTAVSSSYIGKTFSANASWVVGFALKCSGLPTTNGVSFLVFRDAGSNQCELRINLDGTISVTRNGTSVTGGTSTSALSTGAFYFIEMKVTIADSIGANSCKVRVNGVDWITVATGQDLKATSNATANEVLIGNMSSFGMYNPDFDDLYICDQSGSTNNDFLGDCRIDTIFPSGAGNYTQFTPSTGSNYTCVDETAPNTTDYVDGSTVGDRDSYAMGNLSALASQTVYGVQVNAAILKDDAGSKSAATFVRSSSTNGDGASVALGTSQVYVSQVFETDPNGSIAWTEASVNAMEAGVKVTA